jgi:putative peptidoglycan lipid II flippase
MAIPESVGSLTYNRAAGSAIALTCAAVFNGLVGLVPHLIIAAKFGLGGISDAYFMSAAILLTLVKVLEVQTLPKLYISIFAEHLDRPRRLGEIVSNLLHMNLVAFGALVPVLIILGPMLVPVLAPGFDADAKALTTYLLQLSAAALLFVPVLGLFMAVLHSFQRFTLAAALQLIPGPVMVVFVLLTVDSLGISSLVLGNLLGYAVYVVALYVCVGGLGLRHRWVFKPGSPDVRNTARLLLPFLFVSVLDKGAGLFPNLLASMLPGGSFSALVVAKKFRSYLIGSLFDTIPTVIYPSMAKSVVTSNREHLRRLLLEGARMMHFLTFPLLVLVAILSYEIVGVLFQRGAFDEVATRNVAACLALLAVGLLPGGLSVLFSRALFALQETVLINRTTVITTLSEVILSIPLFYLWGMLGLAAATALHTSLNVAQYYVRIRRILQFKSIFCDRSFAQTVTITVCMGAVCLGLHRYLLAEFESATAVARLVRIVGVAGIGVGVYGLLAYIVGVEEFRILSRVVTHSQQRVSDILFRRSA